MSTPAAHPTADTGQAQTDLRVGILGFGLRSGLWRHAHRPGEGSQVVAVCDSGARGRAAAAEAIPGAAVVAGLEELLSEGDTGGHGGADPLLIAEFLRFARDGGPTMTSPVADRLPPTERVGARSQAPPGARVPAPRPHRARR